MKPINRFSLEKQDGPYQTWPVNSRLFFDGAPTGASLPGYQLLCQFEVPDGYILVTDYDCPFEEITNFAFLDGRLRLKSCRWLGWMYETYLLTRLEWVDEKTFIVIINEQVAYRFTIHRWGIPYLRPRLRLEWLGWVPPEGRPNIKIQEAQTPADFIRYYDLRWKVLRKPWDQPRGSEKDDLEEKSVHLIALDRGLLIGVGRVHFNSPAEAQIRFMAILEEYRRKGVGSTILRELERKALERGAKTLVLNSREEVIPFYEKHGYKIIGDAPMLFGKIGHKNMAKDVK